MDVSVVVLPLGENLPCRCCSLTRVSAEASVVREEKETQMGPSVAEKCQLMTDCKRSDPLSDQRPTDTRREKEDLY